MDRRMFRRDSQQLACSSDLEEGPKSFKYVLHLSSLADADGSRVTPTTQQPPLQAATTTLQRLAGGLFCSRSARRPCTIVILAVLLLKLIVDFRPQIYRAGQNAFRALHYSYDPMLFGRNDAHFPAPRCCTGAACAQPRSGRSAVLTLLRSEDYLSLLQQLECSLRQSNPGVELGVVTAEGELPPGGRAAEWMVRHNIKRIQVTPLLFANYHTPRYGNSWLKLRVLNLTQYDAVVLIDSDTVVVGDISPLFSLPVDFAASWDQNKWLGRFNTRLKGINGGVLLWRPCPAVQQHMLQLLESHPKLRYSYGAAEQDFLTWYYRYTGFMLPLEYNTMASDSLEGNTTIGGRAPVIVHFTQNKPFGGSIPGKPGHQFLCRKEQLLV